MRGCRRSGNAGACPGFPTLPDMSAIESVPAPADHRLVALTQWVRKVLAPDCSQPVPASADASFRRYFRVTHAGRSYVVMDAPPAQEDCRPFIKVAGLLHAAGLNAPRILAQDLAQGFLLLSDMGNRLYLRELPAGDADTLMTDAIDALIRWQLASRPGELPAYDDALLRRELALFPDWYVARHLRADWTPGLQADWALGCDLLVQSALAQTRVYVHRDYMPRNLMLTEPNPGILDFQDAVEGPITYDVVSLFKDAFLSWPAERIDIWRQRYWSQAREAGLPLPDYTLFCREFDWMGVQRHLKVLGIFARINYRDGKPHYLADTPRFIRYVREVLPRYPELAPLVRVFDGLGLQ